MIGIRTLNLKRHLYHQQAAIKVRSRKCTFHKHRLYSLIKNKETVSIDRVKNQSQLITTKYRRKEDQFRTKTIEYLSLIASRMIPCQMNSRIRSEILSLS
jgi:hypothetical protein